MTLLQLIVIALVQGITEFLPISSSGHLILTPMVFGWQDQGVLIDVAVHVGTLGAVMAYVWRDLWVMLRGLLGQFKPFQARPRDHGARLAGQVIVATLPVIAAGFLLHSYAGDALRSMEVIAWTTLVFGILLWVADRSGMTIRRLEHMGWRAAIVIGLFQVLALIPGTSRSGITMTAARFLGYERPDAARFSMLLGIPAIMGAGVLATKDLIEAGDAQLTAAALVAGGLAFVSAFIAIVLMMAWLRRASFTPFVVYRLALGVGLLVLVYA